MELKASNDVCDLDLLVGGCARDRRLQAFRIYLDKLFNQYVSIVRSLTSVLALGESFYKQYAQDMDLLSRPSSYGLIKHQSMLCLQKENHIVGAPCGVMGQIT
ncbi:uncharacterized protein LOC115986574 isoform X2 [Quercus lobata]|uniref:uncharacterized protein LOC115986574 isoform X2 n=1 Tax=Quercus lobata TaxID=97700 RepID=UPI0012453DF5|nr:uncharacterized protein LOC115986574 isoform X2 [Quercus lobata]XP_030965579.1 uncharacterized protein LOC115986574 isoform X2 [Quercus lobata]